VRIGAFELDEPIPDMHEPYCFATLRPWIDVNNVGTMIFDELETRYEARELARLATPGNFFDFTRYRPTIQIEEGIRQISVPNVSLRCATREGYDHDLLFLHLLEPHARGEIYVRSVLRLLETLRVTKYCLVGSMYDIVPHTRPLIVNGGAIGPSTEQDLKKSGALPSHYQGPTSILTLITQQAPTMGIDTIWLIASLPQYVTLEKDYLGKVRLMEVLNLLYNIPIDKEDFEKAVEQRTALNKKVEETQDLKSIIPQLEKMYDARVMQKDGEPNPEMSHDVEEMFWKIMGDDDIGKA
jgi:hypothetical protein